MLFKARSARDRVLNSHVRRIKKLGRDTGSRTRLKPERPKHIDLRVVGNFRAGARGGPTDAQDEAVAAILAGPESWSAFRDEKSFENLRWLNLDRLLEGLPTVDTSFVIGDENRLDGLLERVTETEERHGEEWSFTKRRMRILDGYDFSGVDFSGSLIVGTLFRNCNLESARFISKCSLIAVKFEGNEIASNIWFDDSLMDHVLIDQPLDDVDAFDAELRDVSFQQSVRGASFWSAHFKGAVEFLGGITGRPVSYDAGEERSDAVRRSFFYDCVNTKKLRIHDCQFVDFGDCDFNNLYVLGTFKNCEVTFCDFRQADFMSVDLTSTRFGATNIRGAKFNNATMSDTRFNNVIYKRRELQGLFSGIEEPEGIVGDLISRQDLRDQVFLDSLSFDFESALERRQSQLKRDHVDSLVDTSRVVSIWDNLGSLIQNISFTGIAAGSILAVIYFAILFFEDGAPVYAGVLMVIFAGGFGGFINTTLGQKYLVTSVWRFLDYGRDWDRVVLLAGILVFLLGWVYHFAAPDHICFEQGLAVPAELACNGGVEEGLAIYPWYVATMGFATLGLSDLADVRTAFGASLFAINVLLGFLTLGLLLAVVQRSFTRRS